VKSQTPHIVAMTETTTLLLDPHDILETPHWLLDARATYRPTPCLDLQSFGVSQPIASIIYDVECLSPALRAAH